MTGKSQVCLAKYHYSDWLRQQVWPAHCLSVWQYIDCLRGDGNARLLWSHRHMKVLKGNENLKVWQSEKNAKTLRNNANARLL